MLYPMVDVHRWYCCCTQDQPVPLTRSWCLWELYCTAAAEGARFSICLCPAQLASLELAVKSNPLAVLNAMSRIDVQTAQAGSETDQTAILRAVQSSPGGVEGINQLATGEVRQWLLQTARRLMSDLLIENAGKTALTTETSIAEGHMLALCLGHYLGAWSDALLLFQKVASGYERVILRERDEVIAGDTSVAHDLVVLEVRARNDAQTTSAGVHIVEREQALHALPASLRSPLIQVKPRARSLVRGGGFGAVMWSEDVATIEGAQQL